MEKIKTMKNNEFIIWLQRQSGQYVRQMFNDIEAPKEASNIIINRCIKYHTLEQVNQELHITKAQQNARITIVKQRLISLIDGYFLTRPKQD